MHGLWFVHPHRQELTLLLSGDICNLGWISTCFKIQVITLDGETVRHTVFQAIRDSLCFSLFLVAKEAPEGSTVLPKELVGHSMGSSKAKDY